MQEFTHHLTSTVCPDRETLVDFNLGRLSEDAISIVSTHVCSCRSCKPILEEVRDLASTDGDILCLRRSFEQPTLEVEPACERMMALALLDPTIEATAPEVVSTGEKVVNRWIGPYQVLSILGEGGMGIVYRARQVTLDRMVALKMIATGRQASLSIVVRFLREGRVLARLQHPNIVQIHELSEQDGHPYYSMDLIEGGSLRDLLKQGPLDPKDAATLVSTLALAVAYAHKEGVIHRDLKPGNILFTKDGEPKISDFGLAKLLVTDGDGDPSGRATETESGQVLGTLSYMAPEQLTGRSGDIGPCADVYALGGILYETLAGRPPFRSDSRIELQTLVQTAEPIRPSQIRPDVPRWLEAICLKCLEKHPSRRYPSAQALADDLGRWLRDERPQGISRWHARLARRARRHVASLLCVAALLALALAWRLNNPERALASIQSNLAHGRAVTLVGPTGLPRWSRWRTEGSGGQFHVGDDKTLNVQTWSVALLELMPDPQVSSYRFRAQMRHDMSKDVFGEIGLYCSQRTLRTPHRLVDFFICTHLNARRWRGERIAQLPVPTQKLPDKNLVELSARLFAGDPVRPEIDCATSIPPRVQGQLPRFEIKVSVSVREGATLSGQWVPPGRLRRESFEGASWEG